MRLHRISLRLNIEPKQLHLTVADTGCGFEPEDVFTSAHGNFGLIGMRERAEGLGGELRLESQPGKGTQVDVTVPVP
jgi:signal transduction histidine kinase